MEIENVLIRILVYYNLIDKTSVSDKFKIICPFHGDVNASLLVDAIKNEFFCFGCQRRGNANDFVRFMEHIDSLQAAVKISKILKTTNNSNYHVQQTEVMTDEQALFEAKRYFYSLPKPDWTVEHNTYMEKRGFQNSTLAKVDARINYNDNYGIIFPMKENGKFKGYVCRATNKEMEEKRKYLYNKGFTRRNTLLGNYKYDVVIVVEGYMDWLRFIENGIESVVAILGWKAAPLQIEKLQQYTNKIVSALDNTDTGKAGTEHLKKYFDVVRFSYQEYIKDTGELNTYEFRKAWADTIKAAKKQNINIKI